MESHSFENEHGEKFILVKKPETNTILMGGNETDWKMISLFNDSFNMYSNDELYKLAKVLERLAGY